MSSSRDLVSLKLPPGCTHYASSGKGACGKEELPYALTRRRDDADCPACLIIVSEKWADRDDRYTRLAISFRRIRYERYGAADFDTDHGHH